MKLKTDCDIILIGAGIMSATLASILKQLEPSWKIKIIERLEHCAEESSMGLNNAGTGHSGFCELNYDTYKAVKVCESFEKSKQFWSYLVRHGSIENKFIHNMPHISFVTGEGNVKLLKQRCDEFKTFCLFEDMEFSDDVKVLNEWMPLIMKDRDLSIPIAATRVKRGTDIDFGKLTSNLMEHLGRSHVDIVYNEEVHDLKYNEIDGFWYLHSTNLKTGAKSTTRSNFVFVGAGGAALTLLEKSGISEAKGYGGFPVSGQWLICTNKEVVKQHHAKVYGKPDVGAPPMSVPHLDTRVINGKEMLLFGPYAGFSTKFLKNGSWLDFFRSIRAGNLFIIIESGLRNLGLVKYLWNEVLKTKEGKFNTLLKYYPTANKEDWKLATAGQRVQVIKKENGKAIIEFGTEIVTDKDNTIAGLLGASPGASVSVQVALDVIKKLFPHKYIHNQDWVNKLKLMVPSFDGHPLHMEKELFKEIENNTSKTLGLSNHESAILS